MRKIQLKLQFSNGVWVDADGRSGGIALLWTSDVEVSIRSSGQRHIDFEVKNSSGESWRGTGIYGWSEAEMKWKTWDLIRGLGDSPKMSWLLVGDFNEVWYESEKNDWNACDLSSIKAFRKVLEECELKDLGFQGYKYTWSNRRGEDFIEKRLDRALANEEWMDIYPSFVVSNITWDSSDHCPILVNARKNVPRGVQDSPWDERPFMFEAMWLHVDEFGEVVANAWNSAELLSNGSWSEKVS